VCHNVQRDHLIDNILGDIEKGVTTRSRVTNFYEHCSFVSSFEPFKVEEGTFISQTEYTCDILKKFGKDMAKSIKTHMGTNQHLDLDLGDTSVDQKIYRSMIGSLLYLCASMPDIMLSVCMCARF
jgi:hypothetical protein